MNIQKELSKGSSSLLVLSVLGTGDMYGYQIIKEIEQRSEFVFSFKEGTLYPILHGFEQEGLVKSYWQDGERGKRRKYYHITDRGLKNAQQIDRGLAFVFERSRKGDKERVSTLGGLR